MKNKIKQLSIAFALLMLGSFYVNAQNPFWTLPPNYWDGDIVFPLPAPGASDNDHYDGTLADHAHNSIAKPNGEILFFVVDNVVYDGEGRKIDDISIADGGGSAINGSAEIGIIPDPSNCDRYYIITAGRQFEETSSNIMPYYVILDMSKPNPSSMDDDAFGEFVTFEGDPAYYFPALPLNIGGADFDMGSPKKGCSFAASDKRADGSHLLMISNGYKVYSYRIDDTGIHYDNYQFYIPAPAFNSLAVRCEMEMIELNTGGYRIAVATNLEVQPEELGARAVFICEVNENGVLNPNQTTQHLVKLEYESFESNIPHPHGLEFSPNGEVLYISHSPSTLNPNPIEYFDITNSQLGLQPLLLNNATDFQNSQIEIGIDEKLYFAGSNRMATLSDPDDPQNALWNDQAIIVNYFPNYGGYSTLDESRKTFVLPDQIDQMDYSQYPFYPNQTVTVSGVETWTPENNPLSNDELVRIKTELPVRIRFKPYA